MWSPQLIAFSVTCLLWSLVFMKLEALIFHFSTVGRQERGQRKGETFGKGHQGPGLKPRTAAARTIAFGHGRALNPYTTSAAPKPVVLMFSNRPLRPETASAD
ncbi:hypothetical protein ILYODFUR_023912 [Ilyodon furcidens]|uniref:Secreted protein n=1 Tax=Ilyodon furcidens TaxID=33524 RepID=A0ABV0VJB5_9TELE